MSTSLINSALDGLAGAALTGALGWIAVKRAKPSKQEYDEAWKKQAGELQTALATQYEARVAYAEGQCENRDREIVAKDKEIARLQRELGRAQRGNRRDD